MIMPVIMIVAMPVIFTMAVAGTAAAGFGHTCQHAQGRPLQHINNSQPGAPAPKAQHLAAAQSR
jgi:hypothetical protein